MIRVSSIIITSASGCVGLLSLVCGLTMSKAYSTSLHTKKCSFEVSVYESKLEDCIGGLQTEEIFFFIRPKIKTNKGEVFFNEAQIRGHAIASQLKTKILGNQKVAYEVVPKYRGKDEVEARVFYRESLWGRSTQISTTFGALKQNGTGHFFSLSRLSVNLKNQAFDQAFSLAQAYSDDLRDFSMLSYELHKPFGFEVFQLSLFGLLGTSFTRGEVAANIGFGLEIRVPVSKLQIISRFSLMKDFNEASMGLGVFL